MTEAGGGHLLASRADRERVVDILKAAFTQGRLTQDELEARVAQVLGSRTYGELAVVTADIPAGPGGPGAAWRPDSPDRTRANLIPVLWAVGGFAAVPVLLIALSLPGNNEGLAETGLFLFLVDFVVAVLAGLAAIGAAVDKRMKSRRPGSQLPPRPGPRGGPPCGGTTGHDPVRPAARRDAIPGAGAIAAPASA